MKTHQKNKKRALKKARQSHRKHYDEVTRAKEVWNQLRPKTATKEERVKLMKELMELITGRMKEIAGQHDASRVIQAAIKFGNEAQRRIIVQELAPAIPELCKLPYSHFVVLKLVTHCCGSGKVDAGGKNERTICKAFKGHMCKLAVHAVGARVIEVALTHLSNSSSNTLRQELYGKHYTLFLSNQPKQQEASHQVFRLKNILDEHPTQKQPTLQHIHSLLNKCMEKTLFGFAYVHHLLWEYLQCCTNTEVRAFVSSTSPPLPEHVIHMISTRAGARTVAHTAACGTAKDRRKMLKSFKGYTRSSLLHKDAYLAILRLVDVTDDTVAVQKLLLAEIVTAPNPADKQKNDDKGKDNKEENDAAMDVDIDKDDKNTSPLLELALSDTASKLFYLVLAPEKETTYFDPMELEVLHQPITVVETSKDGDDSDKVEVPTSKKDAKVRQEELRHYLRDSLIDLCRWHAAELLTSRSGAKVLRLVYDAFPSCRKDVTSAVVEATSELALFEDVIAHRVLESLLRAEAEENEVWLATSFMAKHRGKLWDVVSVGGRGAFVVAALAGVSSVGEETKKELKKHRKEIEKRSKGKDKDDEGGDAGGFGALHGALFEA